MALEQMPHLAANNLLVSGDESALRSFEIHRGHRDVIGAPFRGVALDAFVHKMLDSFLGLADFRLKRRPHEPVIQAHIAGYLVDVNHLRIVEVFEHRIKDFERLLVERTFGRGCPQNKADNRCGGVVVPIFWLGGFIRVGPPRGVRVIVMAFDIHLPAAWCGVGAALEIGKQPLHNRALAIERVKLIEIIDGLGGGKRGGVWVPHIRLNRVAKAAIGVLESCKRL